MRRMFLCGAVFLVVLFVSPLNLEAQRRSEFQPFLKMKVTREQYVRACELNSMGVLNISCDEIARAAFAAIGRTFSGRQEFASWMSQLEVRPCPRETVRLSRVDTKPVLAIDTNGWTRPLRTGEMCLYEDNRPVISLDCGNFINQPFVLGEVVAKTKPQVFPESPTRLPPDTVIRYIPNEPVVIRRGSPWWKWPAIIAGTVVAGCGLGEILDEWSCLGKVRVRQRVEF